MMDSAQIVSTINYTKVERSIENFQQQNKRFEYSLLLTDNAVQSNSHLFKLKNVFDMSYKPFTNGDGILYLHTNEGVFSYIVSTDPKPFIRAYQRLASGNGQTFQ